MPLIIGELNARIEVTPSAPKEGESAQVVQVATAEARRLHMLSELRMARERKIDPRPHDDQEEGEPWTR